MTTVGVPGHPFQGWIDSFSQNVPPPPGVAFNGPPQHLIADAIAHVTNQMSQLPPEAHGAIVAVGNRSGVNAAVAVKGPLGTQIVAWVGKDWTGPIDFGVQGIRTF